MAPGACLVSLVTRQCTDCRAECWYLDRMTELLGDSLFTNGDCASSRSYYFNPSGEATLLRPMPRRTAIREASDFPITDYQIN